MILPLQVVHLHIAIQNPATGAATDADSLPTATVYRNGVLDGVVTVTIANAATGSYSGSFAVPVGYAAGDDVQVRAQAVVSGITSPPVVVWQDIIAFAQTLTVAERIEIADALLKRDWTQVTGEASRSMLNALRFLRNRWYVVATLLHVAKEDDTTDAWTSTLSTNPTADPITGSDPT